MDINDEFRSVLEVTGDTIDALYAGRQIGMSIDALPPEFLETLRFDVNLISQALEKAVAGNRNNRDANG